MLAATKTDLREPCSCAHAPPCSLPRYVPLTHRRYFQVVLLNCGEITSLGTNCCPQWLFIISSCAVQRLTFAFKQVTQMRGPLVNSTAACHGHLVRTGKSTFTLALATREAVTNKARSSTLHCLLMNCCHAWVGPCLVSDCFVSVKSS